MLHETNLNHVKSVAGALLMTDINETEFSPMIVQHPFTSSGITAVRRNGGLITLDIVQNKDDLRIWRAFMLESIRNAKSARDIYIMVNKPYTLTFLKFASPHLSKADFSELLADAWISSENPNNDPNLSKSKLISMFKNADPAVLMDESEYKELQTLDDPVTVYRGVTSHNAKNIRALSWTLDRGVAEWFAHRFNEDGTVYEAQINKEHILALFNGRNESEVIVDPKHLTDIEQAEEPDFGMKMT